MLELNGVRKKHKQPLDDIMTEADLAILVDKSQDTLWEWRGERGLPYIKVGKDVYYSQKAVYNWLLSLQKVNNNHKGSKEDEA